MNKVKAKPVSKSQKSYLTLNEARAMLVAALGDNAQKYFKHLQEWFKLRTSKEVIDTVARRYLKHDGLMHYHEIFILTLLNKVSGLNEKSLAAANKIVFSDGLVCPRMSKLYRPASPVQPSVADQHDTDVKSDQNDKVDQNDIVDQNDKVDQNDQGKSLTSKATPKPEVNMAKDVYLPSQALIHGRFLLTSWDNDLQGVDSASAELLLEATKTLLKNVLTAIINDVKPFNRCTWSHMYHVERDIEMLYKEGESFDVKSLFEDCQRDAMMNLLPKEGEPNYAPLEYYTVPLSSTSHRPMPQEAETTLTAVNVFDSLRRNPNIITLDSILTRTIMRASTKMKQVDNDEAIS